MVLHTFKSFKWPSWVISYSLRKHWLLGHFNELDISFVLSVTYVRAASQFRGSLILCYISKMSRCERILSYIWFPAFPTLISLSRLDVRLVTNHNNGNNHIEIDRNYIHNHGKFVIFAGLILGSSFVTDLSNHQSVMQSNFQLFSKLSMFVIRNMLQAPP